MGAVAVEVHLTMSRYMFGPDVKASVVPEQLKEIVEGGRFITDMLRSKKDIHVRTEEQAELKNIFSKSIYYASELNVGHIIAEKDLVAKKPNCGVDSSMMVSFIGKELTCDVRKDQALSDEDFK
jgi:N-acetylneuraminate synthase